MADSVTKLGQITGGDSQIFPVEAECIKQRVDEVFHWVDSLEHKLKEVEEFYSTIGVSNSGSSCKDTEKGRHVVGVRKIQQEAARREAVAAKRMQDLMRQFGPIFRQITQHKCAWPFMHPVNVEGLGLDDYYEVIDKPMDFSTIKNQMEAKDGTGGNLDLECGTGRKISKIYRALANGIIEEDEVVIKQPIGVVRYPGVAKGLYVASKEGKPALSKVYVLERDRQRDCTLVKVEIQSGRPHQIRIHLAYIGHPLVGDPLYVAGGQPKCCDSDVVDAAAFAEDGGYRRPNQAVPGDCGYHLHAHQVELPNLLNTHKVVKIVAPLPPILQTSSEVEEEGFSSCK